MDNEVKQALIDALTRASIKDHPIAIKHKDKPLAVVLPLKDYQKFQDEREEKLRLMKMEFDGILTLIRRYTNRQSLEEVKTRLAALRQKIEQEGK